MLMCYYNVNVIIMSISYRHNDQQYLEYYYTRMNILDKKEKKQANMKSIN